MKRKTLRAKALGGSQKTSGKLCQLFSSFLRGASCPKSPRVKCSFDSVGATLAATAAKLFMPEGLADVKSEVCRVVTQFGAEADVLLPLKHGGTLLRYDPSSSSQYRRLRALG